MERTNQSAGIPLDTDYDYLLPEDDHDYDLMLKGVDPELWHEVGAVLNDADVSLTLDSILAIIAIRRGSASQPERVLEDLLLNYRIEACRLHDGEADALFSIDRYEFLTTYKRGALDATPMDTDGRETHQT